MVARFKSFFKWLKFRLFDLPKRLNAIESQFETVILEVHAHNTLALEAAEKLSEVQRSPGLLQHQIQYHLAKERKLRIAQGLRAGNKLKEEMLTINNNFDQIRKELSEFFVYKDRYDKMEGLHKKVEIDYKDYLKKFKAEYSAFKKNDDAIRRLAHLEERITLIELSNKEQSKHGSGQAVSG